MKTRKFKISSFGKDFEVEVEDLGGNMEENLKPKTIVRDEIKVVVGGEEYSLKVEDLTFLAKGSVEFSQVISKPEAKSEVTLTEGTPIKAPMRGTIVKILVKIGDKVKRGDPVVVLEAMKMENLIESHVSGVVKQIVTSVGSTVATGDPLIIVG